MAPALMAPEQKCLEYARECVRLAGLSEDQQTRDRLFDMAREWMVAAMDGHDCDPLAPRSPARTGRPILKLVGANPRGHSNPTHLRQ